MAARRLKAEDPSALLVRVRKELARSGDPERAKAQQAYMKSVMPYHGVSNGEMRAICKQVFADYAFDDAKKWQHDVLAIWRGAERREERYAAIELAQHRKARAFHTMDALPMFEEMIVTGAWWDYVDALATHDLAAIMRHDKKAMTRTMREWSTSDDLWKRRSSILCQLPFKEETDLELLHACIEPSIENKEFWLRKAIGWALRQLARTNPNEVARYVKENEKRLSGLSKREALKHIDDEVPTSSPSHEAARRTRAADRRTPSRGRRARSRSGD
jgi:3-methyladenine DNA glycosylase AlkD